MPPKKPAKPTRPTRKRGRGHPTAQVLTSELTAQMVEHIKSGVTINDACALEGISKQSHYRWLDEGLVPPGESDHRPACWTYRLEIEAALASYKHNLLKNLQSAASNGQWQASAWILERRFPDEFGRKDKVALSGGFASKPDTPDEPIRLLEVKLTDKRGKPPEGEALGDASVDSPS
jgi:hypothetical protein